jgi:phosphatidylethanolamine-binding protein (PEBP) family uncharacterized protein
MANALTYLQFSLGKLLYYVRGHDSSQITACPAFKSVHAPNMILESTECGPSGSPMLPEHTCLDEDSDGKFPNLRWTPPPDRRVEEYVLTCEDLDLPIPWLVIHHGLFFNIQPSTTSASHFDVQEQNANTKARVTNAGWIYVPNLKGSTYIGPAPPLGHGAHRYVFTIVALSDRLGFTSHEKVTKEQIKDAMFGKVAGWGQWTGVFKRPWPEPLPEW